MCNHLSSKYNVSLCPFRLCREIAQEFKSDSRMTGASVLALQEATEHAIVELMEDTQLCAIHRKQVTITAKDMNTAIRIRRDKVFR